MRIDAPDTEVQSNVISIPFRYINDIYMCYAGGAHVETLAEVFRTTCPVIEGIIRFQHKKALKALLEPMLKGPA